MKEIQGEIPRGDNNEKSDGKTLTMPRPFPRRDNYEIAKIHGGNLKIFFSRTTGPISTKLGTKRPWVKEIQGFTNIEHRILKKVIRVSSATYQRYDKTIVLLKRVY